ncbi:hypothetical protein GCM10011491_05650 [Brucella endophytica]|uniref:Uncharacterized protein n=1 Tax=Brucella endophytica TaxID=1963359 RepID=A0A916S2E0_9HYPH|nr:hypothetical protein [Brucella endophytica]GGA81246.1 hypothetical protein GCM10011491_05650 [Brucella endophytica]
MFFATSGTTLFIGAVRSGWLAQQVDASAFAGEAWVQVNGLSSLGRTSGEWQTIDTTLPNTTDPDNPPIPNHEKAVRPAYTMEVVVAQDSQDTGQAVMLTAESAVDPYAFMLTLADGSERQFIAHIVSASQVMDEANSVVCWSFGLLMQSNIVRTA